jgi:hypothetical protein
MKEKMFLVGTDPMSFRAGEIAEVIGTAMFTPKDHARRPGFIIRFNDGIVDQVPIFAAPDSNQKNPHYELITQADIEKGNIPKVIH